MVKMSDILKKAKERNLSAQESPPPTLESPPGQAAQGEQAYTVIREEPLSEQRTEYPSESGVRISEVMMSKHTLLKTEECVRLYEETIELVKNFYDKAKAGEGFTEEERNIIARVEKIAEQQYLGNDNILNLINSTQKDDFIHNHALNVSIIAIDMGIGLGYGRDKLVELGSIAIEHDIGMVEFYNLYNEKRKLNGAEYNQIKNHPTVGAKILENSLKIYEKAIAVVHQEHERIDGSGYPQGLKGNAIDEYAKIIGLSDVYEAMTHSRPYRTAIYTLEALKQLIKSKNSFERKIMKVFLERVASPFPLGSYVELSSGEKGRVTRRNFNSVLRPGVEIIYDSNGEKLEEPKDIDLSKHLTIYIKSILKNEEAQETNSPLYPS